MAFGSASVIAGVAFWVFVSIVVLAGVWLAYARNKETQKTIRLAIEKGMQLDATLIDTLVARRHGRPEDYLVGGVICIAVGIGLPILGYFVGRIEPTASSPIIGAGILVGLIGIGLVVCATFIGRHEKSSKPENVRM